MSRVAVVTGAARGIGAATVDALVAQGLCVVAVDRCRDDPAIGYPLGTKAQLDSVVHGHGDRALGLVADVRSSSDMQLAVDTAVEHFGRLDVAVACAGVIAGGGPLWEMSDAAYDAVIDINLNGTRRLFSAATPSLLESGAPRHGRLIAVSSAAGLIGLRHLAAYSAAKHGVVGLTKSLACDLAGTGVTANVICPGSTDTSILGASADLYGLDSTADFIEHQLLGRLLSPKEPASLIAWIASEASSGVTGAALSVDGGMTAT
ncbi:MAG: mycofactocin-coupled SDR family oxidoreductase [Actinomycetes bacterium]